MIETSEQFSAVDKLEQWYRDYKHQVIDLCGVIGTGKLEIIKEFIDRIGFKEFQVMFVSENQSTVINLALKQKHAYYLDSVLYSYYKKTDFSTLRAVNPESNELKFKWIKERNKKINKSYRIIIVLDAELCSLKKIKHLMDFKVPIILVGDPIAVGIPDSYLKFHEPNILVTDITPLNQKNPLIHFIQKIIKLETIPYGNFKSVTVLKKQDTNIYNFKFSDMIIVENEDSAKSVNKLYRENVMKFKTKINHLGERLILTENSHQFLENRTENKIKFYLDKYTTGTITRIDLHGANRKYVSISFKPDGYSEEFTENIWLDRFFLNDFYNRSIQYNYYPPLKFNFGYAIPVVAAQFGHWNDITIIEEPYDDWTYHSRVLYTSMKAAKKSVILIR